MTKLIYHKEVDIMFDEENLLRFPENTNKVLSEKEIMSLFLGLVRLVKRTAVSEVSNELRNECEFATSTLDRTLKALKEKERQIEQLRLENKRLSDYLSKH